MTSAAIVGSVLVTIVTTYGVINRAFGLVTLETARSVGPGIAVLYAPVLLWGPLLFICAVAYHRRRSAQDA